MYKGRPVNLHLTQSLYLAAETNKPAHEAADALKAHLRELEDERKAATTKGEKMAVKSQRLAESIENLQAGALRAMKQNDEPAARELLQVLHQRLWCKAPWQHLQACARAEPACCVLCLVTDCDALLQEKTLVTSALQKCKDRAAINFTLAEKLNKLIGVADILAPCLLLAPASECAISVC